ncbi:acetyl-CoA carboxylase biotin carboxyl carrier protein [Staphylococcus sp. NAM3COL9]|uniref:acetyl-CoA carboxylase biotin carboxyl carrier protein n=1 Tax=Staphylococcus sp. NAM3COL9 TaxID=1667172 RepID=UPI000710DF45|nr:biotin/lipoyl-containing protein [Staphylococcus sp. NAM3COL9]KRG10325.1 acetyl-CoA carboxylase [Staphylococcus sp. NAM3COL9]
MNFEKIEQLIKLVKENEVKKFEYKDSKSEISIDFNDNKVHSFPSDKNVQTVASQESNQNQSVEDGQTKTHDNFKEVKSPMVGMFFLQDEKELTEPIISVGDEINKGDTIGFIEAMKVMNEVKSDVDGVVKEIIVEHGANVEYNQTIIKIK